MSHAALTCSYFFFGLLVGGETFIYMTMRGFLIKEKEKGKTYCRWSFQFVVGKDLILMMINDNLCFDFSKVSLANFQIYVPTRGEGVWIYRSSRHPLARHSRMNLPEMRRWQELECYQLLAPCRTHLWRIEQRHLYRQRVVPGEVRSITRFPRRCPDIQA